MKLHRFTALDNQRAMYKVYETLGPDALVYSTRKIPNGIEVLAGMPQADLKEGEQIQNNDFVQIYNVGPDGHLLDKLNIQLQLMDENIQVLIERINRLQKDFVENSEKRKSNKWSFLKTIYRILLQLKEGFYARKQARIANR